MENKIKFVKEDELSKLNQTFDAIVINTSFEKDELADSSIINFKDTDFKIRYEKTISLIDGACDLLKEGGLIFIHGLPKFLPHYATYLNRKQEDKFYYVFKYWIALEYSPNKLGNILPNSHIGLLMYVKSKDRFQPNGFHLNTKEVRIPHQNCPSCKKESKDWGGKNHLRNNLGAAVSDVWSDLYEEWDSINELPPKAIDRLYKLVYFDKMQFLVIGQNKLNIKKPASINSNSNNEVKDLEIKEDILLADSIEYMEKLHKKYPNGVFDLVFADPPYNLAKNYNGYSDTKTWKDYVSWCNKWLGLMSKVLKPGGALLVLNIPKWAVYHAEYLNQRMEFRHWIVWDAMSTPAGKLMPSHYSLLYYIKPGAKPKSNLEKIGHIDSRVYCLRNNCIQVRKKGRFDKKEDLSDIWHDIHRIKHKKDRDAHPCQLPIKLMDRIIQLTSYEGDWVYDPFGGAGTTAMSAKIKKRHFIISDLDKKYIEIAQKNLSRIQTDLVGNMYLIREKVQMEKPRITKREIEVEYINLCKKNKRVVPAQDLKNKYPQLYSKIEENYPDTKKLYKITRRLLEVDQMIIPNQKAF